MSVAMKLAYKRDINDPLVTFCPETLLMRGDREANVIELTVMDGSSPVDLSGYTAVVMFQRPGDSDKIRCPGSISGNVISVPLLADCYAYSGQYYASLVLNVSGFTRTMLRLAGHVESNGDGLVVDPTGTIPGYEDLARIYAELEESLEMADAATDGANEAAKNANENAELANEAAGNANAAADSADEATIRANEASESIEGLTVEASDVAYNQPATATVTDVEGHKHIAFGLRQGVPGPVPKLTFTGETGEPNTDVVITQSGPPEAPIVNLKIPQGVPGTGNVSTVDGLMPGSGGDVDLNAVRYVAQTLDDAKKQQARTNIGAGTGDGTVLSVDDVQPGEDGNVVLSAVQYAAQTLTAEQQQQARTNIGSMSVSAFPYIIGAPLWGDGGADLSAAFSSAEALYDAVSSNNFRYIRNGDYWPIELNGSFYDYASSATKQLANIQILLEANINTFQYYGNGGGIASGNPHVLFCSKNCLPLNLQYRSDATTWYDDSASNPWLGSALYQTLNNPTNGIISLLLASNLGEHIYSGPSGNGMRAMMEIKAPGTTSASGSRWFDRGRLFLPSEYEVIGGHKYGIAPYSEGVEVQWPVFAMTKRRCLKRLGTGSAIGWWLETTVDGSAASIAYMSNLCSIRGDGAANITYFSVPICFIFGGD